MGRKSKNKNRKIQEKVAENSTKPTLKIEEKVEENTQKLTPNVDERVSENSNIEVLRRTDQSIEEFLMKADDVECCEFDEKARDWNMGVRGGLYLVKRSIEPQYQVIVFNGQDQGKVVENIEEMEINVHVLSVFCHSKTSNKHYWIRFYSSPEFLVTPTFIQSSPQGSQPKDQTTKSESEHEKGGAHSSSMAEVLQEPLVRDSSFWNFVDTLVKIGMNRAEFWMQEHKYSSSSTSTTVAASPTGLLSPSRFVIPDSSAPTEKDDNSIGGSRKGNNSVDNTSLLVPPSTTTTSPPSLVRTNTVSHRPIISKDEIRSALQNLIQEDTFISMFSDALEKALD